MKRTNLLLTTAILMAGTLHAGTHDLDLKSGWMGTEVLRDYSGTPDKGGLLEMYRLQIPEFKRASYFRGPWWPYAGNRVTGEVLTKPDAPEGGLFLLLELVEGDYLAILPLTGDQATAWLHPAEGVFQLKLGTHGLAPVKGNLPFLSWARSSSPYDAVSKVWKMARECEQIDGWMKLREEKTYPEMFKYLGWCSWEGYHKNITSDSLVAEFKGLRDSEVPIRYFLVDDGHFDTDTIGPHKDKFPQGYKPLTDLRTEDGIRWVGMWYALLGENRAMPAGQPAAIVDSMMLAANGRMVAKPDAESIETFLDYMLTFSERDDIDFVKVDFCGHLLPTYAGGKEAKAVNVFPPTKENAIANPSAGTTVFARLYQKVVDEKFDGLMNCNAHVPHFIFNSGESVVGRCSSDYKLGDLNRAKAHLYESYSASVWLGQTQWGDHDMFHSSDPTSGRMMAVSKALSGGPIYLSDRYPDLVPEEISPLCYEDGLLPRPVAPATPLVEDLFCDKDNARLYRASAPLANRAAAFVLYNFQGEKGSAEPILSSQITPADYQAAAGMIQLYPGLWDVPEEGLLVYDHYQRTAKKMGDGYTVSIGGFGDRLLQVSPIQNGWSVIGRTDKYLSAATVTILSCDAGQLKIELHEAGPFAIWLADGTPKAAGIYFESKGDGLFLATMPVEPRSVVVCIER